VHVVYILCVYTEGTRSYRSAVLRTELSRVFTNRIRRVSACLRALFVVSYASMRNLFVLMCWDSEDPTLGAQ
jgi:hypothetical protein